MKTITVTSALSDDARKIAGEALHGTLVELIDLSLLAKQAHWNLVGRRFRSIHLQLDDVVEVARGFADTVAERSAAIGVPADGRASTITQESRLTQLTPGWAGDDAVVAHFVEVHGQVIERLRKRIEETEEPDPVTQDLLIAVTAALEKTSWMWQAENIPAGNA